VASDGLVRMDEIDRLIAKHGPALVQEALAPLLSDERIARVDAVLDARLASLSAVIEDLYDPHNGAAAIRSTEALGLQSFHAIEPNARFTAIKGITRGCHRWIDLHRWADISSCAEHLHARGFRLYGTSPAATDDLETVDVSTPVAVMFGNEHAGLTGAAKDACDGTIAIPMHGFTESFNLSVSVALVMSRLAARRREHLGARGDLSAERKIHLRARWFALRIRGAPGVVERYVSTGTRPSVVEETQTGAEDELDQ
jgi:tRNA (guanosine-2'-O-)-methyltransferase